MKSLQLVLSLEYIKMGHLKSSRVYMTSYHSLSVGFNSISLKLRILAVSSKLKFKRLSSSNENTVVNDSSMFITFI